MRKLHQFTWEPECDEKIEQIAKDVASIYGGDWMDVTLQLNDVAQRRLPPVEVHRALESLKCNTSS